MSTAGLHGIPRARTASVGASPIAGRVDAVTMLSAYLLFLFALPARLVVPPLGAVGTPAFLVGVACAWWWAAARATSTLRPAAGTQPVRTAVLVHAWFMLLAYAVAYLRPLTELEVNGSNRALLNLIALTGVALLAADAICDREELTTLLRRIVAAAGFLAGIGLVQFATGFDPVDLLRVPFLRENGDLVGVGTRSSFNRPYGTTLHPIEFGVVLGALLPLALHFALTARPGRGRWRAWAVVWLIAAGVPMSLSRSAVVALGVGLLGLAGAWTWRRRANAAAAAVAFTGLMWALIPGLIGTIRGLFVGLDTDPSVQARLDRIPRIVELFSERPWFGRGLGTFSVDDYFLIDNEWYVSAIEVGIVGMSVIALLILAGIVAARAAGRTSGDPSTKHLGYAVGASLLALFAAIGTFDAFFYRIFTGVLFLLLGCAAALWRIERKHASVERGDASP